MNIGRKGRKFFSVGGTTDRQKYIMIVRAAFHNFGSHFCAPHLQNTSEYSYILAGRI